MNERLGVAVVGCGLIGRRRAAVAAADSRTRCVVVADVSHDAATALASEVGAASTARWQEAVDRDDIDIVVVATPNGYLKSVAIAALNAGKHVLTEKPMGRCLAEALDMRTAAVTADRRLKVGFNHRYHPAIRKAHHRLDDIGEVVNVRCRYGHGGRSGYEKEWRGNRELAGGGELTDQGVHVVDLIHWFAGVPVSAFGLLQSAVWPLGDLEDNAFGLLQFSGGAVASFHTSWTQWKNLFSFEVHGRLGAVIVDGLGRSYGPETLTVHLRRSDGGAPATEQFSFPGEDDSWRDEWADFLDAICNGTDMLGSADDGVVAMRIIEALYRSAAEGGVVML